MRELCFDVGPFYHDDDNIKVCGLQKNVVCDIILKGHKDHKVVMVRFLVITVLMIMMTTMI